MGHSWPGLRDILFTVAIADFLNVLKDSKLLMILLSIQVNSLRLPSWGSKKMLYLTIVEFQLSGTSFLMLWIE